eukprot:251206_1
MLLMTNIAWDHCINCRAFVQPHRILSDDSHDTKLRSNPRQYFIWQINTTLVFIVFDQTIASFWAINTIHGKATVRKHIDRFDAGLLPYDDKSTQNQSAMITG